jgi:Tol biopolymer transport system component
MMSSGKSSVLSGSTVLPASMARPTGRRRSLLLVAGFVIAAAAVAAMALRFLPTTTPPASPLRLHALILPPAGMFLTNTMALSPDAQRLVFVAADATGERQLWMRPLASGVPHVLNGTRGASDPFWSPDGEHLAFFAQGKLRRMAASGGAVTDVTEVANPAGGTWNQAGVIVFARLDGPLMRVAADGGRAEPLLAFDETLTETHQLYPTFLPDGEHMVFYANSRERGLYVVSLDGSGKTRLFDPDPTLPAGAAATPGIYASGHLLYVRDRVLMARRFDLDQRTTSAEPITVAETVDYDPPGQAAFTMANDVLVFRARAHRPQAELVWVDRQGQQVGTIASPPGTFRRMTLSPDGRTLAIDRRDAQGLPSVWLVDAASATSSRLTAAYWAAEPLWSPDGRMLAYSIAVDSPPNLVLRAPDPNSTERRLTRSAGEQHYATSFTPDGQQLVYHAIAPTTGLDLHIVSTSGETPTAQRLLQTRANEHSGRVSPDGRWIAYVSDESGQPEVYVSRFPEMQGRFSVSSAGGSGPIWGRDGRELFYLGPGGRVIAAPLVAADGALRAGTQTELFRAPLYAEAYTPDRTGSRFLIARPAASNETVPLEVVTHPLSALRFQR